jgi:hypothetical protein
MTPSIALAGCSTTAPELEQCCRELGLPAKLYATRPACLFEAAREQTQEVVARAAAESDVLLIALARCCGELKAEGARRVSAARCTEMLTGSGTYSWLAEHATLALPRPYFSTWLNHPQAHQAIERVLTSNSAASLQAIAAIDQGERGPDPAGMAEIERISGRACRRLSAGLGHLRETLRCLAESAGLTIGTTPPAAIPATQLGPGDDCLVGGHDAAAVTDAAVAILADSLARGVKCVCISGSGASGDLIGRVAEKAPNGAELQESGALQIMSPEALMAEANAADDPQFLVARWVDRAEQALAEHASGLCLLHGDGWADAVGLSSDYLLAYASRLSAACGKWPILNLSECCCAADDAVLWGELARTHPLVWGNGLVRVSPAFRCTDEYLGAEDLLRDLERRPPTFSCDEARPLISALADGELEGPAAAALSQHVERCAVCSQLLDQQRTTKQELAALRQSVEGVADELWARISRELREQPQ